MWSVSVRIEARNRNYCLGTSNKENLILELATYHDGRPEKPVMGT